MNCCGLLVCIFVWLSLAQHLGSKAEVDLRGPSFQQLPPTKVEFSNNSFMWVSCSAEGVPKPVIRWTRVPTQTLPSNGDDERRTPGTRGRPAKQLTDIAGVREVLPNGTLVFHPFSPETYKQDVHSSTYRCEASNYIGTIVSHDVWIRAVVLQHYEAQVYDEFVIAENTGVLRCHIPSFVSDYVTVTDWLRRPIFSVSNDYSVVHDDGGKYTVFSTGELHVHRVTDDDGRSSYACRTSHRLTGEKKVSSTAGRLVVTVPQGSVPPRITDSRSTVESSQDLPVILPCAAQGHPVPVYSWYRNTASSTNKERNWEIITYNDRYTRVGGSLVIKSVIEDDSGIYQCVVNNSIGQEKSETLLVVTSPLQVFISPSSQVYDVGASVLLRCLVSGLRPPVTQLVGHVNVYWVRNGEPVTGDQQDITVGGEYTLAIQSFSREDAGMYQCFARNGPQVAQASAEIRIGDAPPQLHHQFPSEALYPGASVSFSCSASGLPQPEVSWTLDEADISSDRRFVWNTYVNERGDTVAFLNISSVRVQDGGLYGCSATNRISSQHHFGRLNIYGSPYIRPTRPITAIADNDVRLRCPYAGYPIDSVHWERDSLKLPLERRHKVSNDGSLKIIGVQPITDAGRYTCVVRGANGERASRDIELTILVSPAIAPFSFQEGKVVEGIRVRTACYVTKGDLPITITWSKDGSPLLDNSVNVRVIDEYSNVLTIDSVKASHGGSYTCWANNSVAVANHTATLTVNVLPRWRVEPRDVDVIVGGNATLDCSAYGSPQPTITWLKNEGISASDTREVTLQLNSRVVQLSNGSLQLRNVLELDRGQYVCQVTNGVGAGLSRVVQLRVNVPPSFERHHVNITWIKGEDIRVWCTAHGDLPMDIAWSFNGQLMTSSPSTTFDFQYEISERLLEGREGRGMKSEVVIQRSFGAHHRSLLKSSDVFKCEAKNLHGSSESFIHLIMQEPPDPPVGVSGIATSSRNIRVTWTPPYDVNSGIARHTVQLKKISDSTWNKNVTQTNSENNKCTAVITDLTPNTDYHVRVIAENQFGSSAASDVIRVSTQQEAPSGPPRNVSAMANGPNVIRVTWMPPMKEYFNGIIVGYNLIYRKTNSDDNHQSMSIKVLERSSGPISHLITGLAHFTNYSISVQAFNAQGDGPSSSEIVVVTAENVPSKPPTQIFCRPMSSQSIHLRWEAPSLADANGILLGYKIFYDKRHRRAGVSGGTVKSETTRETQLILQNLDANTEYLIQVLAFTSAGDGVKSDSLTCVTDQDVPDAPMDIKILITRIDAMLLIWRPPEKTNGLLTKYTVYMRTLDRGHELEMTKHPVNPSITQFEALQLVGRYRYEFWVTASTTVGEGKSTKVIDQSPSNSIAAKIVGFDEEVTSKWKSNTTLSCRSVGLPLPMIEWRVGSKTLHSNDRFHILTNGSLLIMDTKNFDNANYTCRARNVYGSDSITYQLVVLSPPDHPHFVVASTTANSVVIKWDSTDSRGSPIIGYSLSYRKDKGEWEEIQLEPEIRFYTVDSLQCGTVYELYMTAFSVIGPGNPSNILKVSTRGSVPHAPSKNAVLTSDMSSVSLLLNGWSGDGCPIDHFTVRYKLIGKSDSYLKKEWTTVSDHVAPLSEPYVVYLQPNSKYLIEVVAFNAAGSTGATYIVDTSNNNLIATSMSTLAVTGNKDGKEQAMFYWSWTLVTPIVLCIILVIVVVIAGCFYMRRLPNEQPQQDVEPSKKYQLATETSGVMDFPVNRPVPPTHYQTTVVTSNNKNDPGNNVEPYATFQLRTDGPNFSWKARDARDVVISENNERIVQQKPFQTVETSYSDDTVPDLLYHSHESSTSDNLSSPEINDSPYRMSYERQLPPSSKMRNRIPNRCSNLNSCYVGVNKRISDDDRLDQIETIQKELKTVLGLNIDTRYSSKTKH
ncbi:Down syndrome cell adhesion molecule-like protein 1 [Chamberlinius hualienensis]